MLILQSSSSELVSDFKSGRLVSEIMEEQCKARLHRCIRSGKHARYLNQSPSILAPSSPLSTRHFHSCCENRILSFTSASNTLTCQWVVLLWLKNQERITTGPRSVCSNFLSKSLHGPENPRLFNTRAAPSGWLAAKPLVGFVNAYNIA